MKRKRTSIYGHISRFLVEKIPCFHTILRILPYNKIVDLNAYPTKDRRNILLHTVQRVMVKTARYSKSKEKIMRKVTYKAKKDFILDLNLNEFTQCGYFFEPPASELIRLLENGGSVFIDIGANVGFFSLLSSYTFDNVISFEPTPRTNKSLKDNIKLNKIKNIQVYDCALSDTKGEMTLYENPYNAGGNSLTKVAGETIAKSGRDDWGKHEVDVKTLDEILDKNNQEAISLIKIDVEGHEAEVLKGSQNTLSKYRPIIFAEIGEKRHGLTKILEVVPSFYKAYNPTNKELIGNDSSLPNDVLLIPTDA
jgi:FkbM family methyltransferase